MQEPCDWTTVVAAKIKLDACLFLKRASVAISFATRFDKGDFISVGYLHSFQPNQLYFLVRPANMAAEQRKLLEQLMGGKYPLPSPHLQLNVTLTLPSSGPACWSWSLLAQCSTFHNGPQSLPFLPRRNLPTRLVHKYQTGPWTLSESS